MRTLKEISNDSFYKMGEYHQLTIDLIQEAESLVNQTVNYKEDADVVLTEIGALQYDIGVTLEIFNPELKQEISDLKDLNSILEIYSGKLNAEFNSKVN